MPFVDEPSLSLGPAPAFAPLAGPDQGAENVFWMLGAVPAEMTVGLHTHGGDEFIRVLEGEIEAVVGGQRRRCGPGTIVVIPPQTEHGLVIRQAARLEIVGEQHMGEWATVIGDDGERRTVEVHTEGMPWAREPPDGRWNTLQELMEIMSSTMPEVRGETDGR